MSTAGIASIMRSLESGWRATLHRRDAVGVVCLSSTRKPEISIPDHRDQGERGREQALEHVIPRVVHA